MKTLRSSIVQFALIMLVITLFVVFKTTQHRQNLVTWKSQTQTADQVYNAAVATEVTAATA